MECETRGLSKESRVRAFGCGSEFKVYVAEYPQVWSVHGRPSDGCHQERNQCYTREAFEYWRNEALNHGKRNSAGDRGGRAHGKSFQSKSVWRYDIGGPIIQDRTHYYVAFERTRQQFLHDFTSLRNSTARIAPSPCFDQMFAARVGQNSQDQSDKLRYAQEWNKPNVPVVE